MFQLIRNNQKKVVAGIAVISMITFVYTGRSGTGTGGRTDREFGTVALHGPPMMVSEVAAAQGEMQALERFTGRVDYSSGVPRRLSLLDAVFGPGSPVASRPELFVLLRREAAADGVQPNLSRAKSLVDDSLAQAAQEGKTDIPASDSDEYEQLSNGTADLIAISDDFNRVASGVKASRPAVDYALATQQQTIQLTLIPIPADPNGPAVKPPTPEQLQAQFRAYADVSPDHADRTKDPFGFGYRSPVRVQVQYLRLTRAAAERAVVAGRSAYDWDLAARKAYYASPAAYLPTTAPAVSPAPKPTPAMVAQALADVRRPLVNELVTNVRQFLTSTLDHDDDAAYAAAPTAASAADGYASLAYLTRLAGAAEAKFNVHVDVVQTPPLSGKELAALPALSDAALDPAAAASTAGDPSLPGYLNARATAYLAVPAPRPASAVVALLQPSPPFLEPSDRAVDLVRLSAVVPAAPAPDLASVRAAVEADCRTVAAYDVAEKQADQLLDAAKADRLQAATLKAGRQLLATDALTLQSTQVIGLVPQLDAAAAPHFMEQAFGLLADYDPATRPHPVRAIADRAERRVFVAQLTSVNARWSKENYYAIRLRAADQLQSGAANAARYAWFNPSAIAQRTGFTPTAAQSHGSGN